MAMLRRPIALPIWSSLEHDSPLRTGILGRCPRCTEGKLFAGILKLAPRCEQCGLDFSFADPADGPAFFTMSVTSFVAVAIAFILQTVTPMPTWALLALVTALTLALSLAMLRPLKGWLVNAQYYYKAGEGVLAEPVVNSACQCEDCKRRYAKKIKRVA